MHEIIHQFQQLTLFWKEERVEILGIREQIALVLPGLSRDGIGWNPATWERGYDEDLSPSSCSIRPDRYKFHQSIQVDFISMSRIIYAHYTDIAFISGTFHLDSWYTNTHLQVFFENKGAM